MLKFGHENQPPNLRLQGQAIDRHPLLGMVDVKLWPVYVKVGSVIAVPAPQAGTVVTLEGEMAFHAGDYIVADNPPTHAWPVRKDVFESTYILRGNLDQLASMGEVHEVTTSFEVIDEDENPVAGYRIRQTTSDQRLDDDGEPLGDPDVETFILP